MMVGRRSFPIGALCNFSGAFAVKLREGTNYHESPSTKVSDISKDFIRFMDLYVRDVFTEGVWMGGC